MQVSVERKEGLERTLKVDIPAERIDGAVEERLGRLQKTAKLDGFRPGKVPYRVVRDRFGPQVRREVLGELIQSTFQEAIGQEELQPAGSPQIDTPELDAEAGGMSYTATFEVYPEVELASIDDLAVEKPRAEVAEADVDQMVETLRKQRREFTAVERAAQQGDQVVIDFVGRVDGEEFQGGSGSDTPVELGSGRMIEGFEEQLEGVETGESRQVEVTFPESAGEELGGKQATFEVTAKEVQEGQLPEVDEEFARGFGVESGSVEELRDGLRRNMERELSQALRSQVKKQVMDALVERNPIDVPQRLVQEEIGRLREQMQQRLGGQMDAAQLGDHLFEQEAKRRVQLGLVLSEIVRANELTPDAESVKAQIEEMAAGYEDPQQVAQYYYQNQEMMQGVEAMVVEEKVVDWVLDHAQVTEQQTTFDAVMNPDSQAQE
ncbi:MAG: trigger factor [Halofilum sp. (in: g-proteobacteria)]